MTDILSRWKAHRQSCHMETDSELLGDELAKEVERLESLISGYEEAMIVAYSDGKSDGRKEQEAYQMLRALT